MQVDCWLCQPAGTPITGQLPGRLGVTSVDVETDVLRPGHVSVERRITRLTDVQATRNTLTLIFAPTNATRFTRLLLRHFHNRDTLDRRLVREDVREAVERPPVQIEVAVPTPVF